MHHGDSRAVLARYSQRGAYGDATSLYPGHYQAQQEVPQYHHHPPHQVHQHDRGKPTPTPPYPCAYSQYASSGGDAYRGGVYLGSDSPHGTAHGAAHAGFVMHSNTLAEHHAATTPYPQVHGVHAPHSAHAVHAVHHAMNGGFPQVASQTTPSSSSASGTQDPQPYPYQSSYCGPPMQKY
ncbi:polyadenylate-binding protein 1-B-like [Thrips palmi]|uniref:Polyadenylate-binding protein 1-B-like n=1 Tax=Thrips palmi TaxID=161013 RepID=A0A6P8YEI4_THRPL|nr:polyadenylate-binding protein 1-B-like [Thrips palmi]